MDPLLERPQAGLGPRSQADLRVDMVEVELYRLFTDADFDGDRLIGSSCENQLKDFDFTRCEI
jgi:hypothetical protein